MVDDARSTELDEILTRAVDRQIAEQRALRQSLDELRDSVRELAGRPRIDLSPLEERLQSIQSATRTLIDRPEPVPLPQPPPTLDTVGLEDRLRSAIQSGALGASETTVASLSEQLRSLREALVPRLDQAAEANEAVRTMAEDLTSVRDVVGGVSNDLEGIAQALIDFNAGLRTWASGIDESVGSIRLTVGELYAVATQPPRERPKELPPAPGRPGDIAATAVVTEPGEEGAEPKGIEDRIKETAELSEYLADQIEDLDGLMGRLTELPQQLEGVVSQALKRTLTARAKLDREAETALDDVLEALDEHVGQLTDVLQRFEQEEDHIRKLALEQVELSSRIESLQETFVDRIEKIDAERRHGEEALAVALDRSARGLAPRALESLSKSTKRRRATAPSPPRKKKAAKTSSTKASGVKKSKSAGVRKQSQRKAKRTTPRKTTRRRDWTPLPDLNDETPA